jgi:hypothetical protein
MRYALYVDDSTLMSQLHDRIANEVLVAIQEHTRVAPVVPAEYPEYAVADKHVLEALLFYAPVGVHKILDEIRVGHQHLTKHNKVTEFGKIGIEVPQGFDLTLLNDPVYHFCRSVKKLPRWRLPDVEDHCFTKSATANSMNDSAPYVACMLMGSQCKSWKNIGIGIAEGNHIVTGVGHVRVKNPSIVYDPFADRNRDAPNSWIRECDSMFKQSLELLKSPIPFNIGMSDDCSSQVFKKKHTVYTAKSKTKEATSQSSWGDHEAWLEVLQVSEMAAALHTIAEHGDLLLKIRIFHRPETQFAVAALANHFTDIDIVAVPQQLASWVMVHYTNKKKLNEKTLNESTNYFLEQCADSTLDVFTPPESCKPSPDAMTKVKQAALEMKRYKDDSFHCIATAVRGLKEDTRVENAFVHATGRISDVTAQVELTKKLRHAMNDKTHSTWLQFMQDIG